MMGAPGKASFCASKAAIIGLTKVCYDAFHDIVTGPRTEGIGSLYFGSKPGLGVISRLIEGPVVNVSIGRRMVQMAPKVSSVKVFKTEFYKVLEENG